MADDPLNAMVRPRPSAGHRPAKTVFSLGRAVLRWKWLTCGFKCPVSGQQGDLRWDAA